MKKILMVLVLCFVVSIACTSFDSKQNSEPIVGVLNQTAKVPNITINDLEPRRWDRNTNIEFITISRNGEKHEYVLMRGYSTMGLSHWESCKYCKTKVKN